MDKRDNKLKPARASVNNSPNRRGKEATSESGVAVQRPQGIEELGLQLSSRDEGIRLEDLVTELKRELRYDQDRIIRKLVAMNEANKIRLDEERPFLSFGSYLLSPLSFWFWGALLATLLSFALIFVSSGYALYLRYVFGALLVLFLPGFSLIEMLYPKRAELEDLTRVALSIGLSLALVPLIGLVLNYTPFGIRLIPIAISLTAMTVIFLIVSLRRKHTYYKIMKDIA